ncbi:MAG: UDP-N-acetylmuramoyl-L-alanyl-D-glutamate--2,6-diaminopimelate ligase [Actinobacteria bacterium]|nr:UDP-N-acetylmuramoyl-L-alanyl-D-glutamate--2,6-diaminopimelate ligase [Actinomycetota bacterium]MCL6105318.1 UDP-N-acetylmuramoyl-L-alanyl-D-glutamate--2,6-diaminopimelate ligase [Actinomycetota bacterium]
MKLEMIFNELQKLDNQSSDNQPGHLRSVGDLKAVEVKGIAFDSRLVTPGDLFCCIAGEKADGHDFAFDAESKGALGLLCEKPLPNLSLPQIVVGIGRARRSMAKAAGIFFANPHLGFVTAGVTGTNGKTTVTHILGSIFDLNGWPSLVIGTLGQSRTTPEAPLLCKALIRAHEQGKSAVAMEVSSHGLAQYRVDCMRFNVAVFTNLSHDHLDYHKDMDSYFLAKARLFSTELSDCGVVNTDDMWGKRLMEVSQIPLRSFSNKEATELEVLDSRISFIWRGRKVTFNSGAMFNVSNVLAAANAALELGINEDIIVEGVAKTPPVEGRFQFVFHGPPFSVVVDYAHTPDALRSAIHACRQVLKTTKGGRVLVVFGCGGTRDATKRPEMGAVASELADVVVITSDNPRYENPEAIVKSIESGIVPGSEVLSIVDRAEAIYKVCSMAKTGDIVLVAGKGHETTQQIGDEFIDFSDTEVVKSAVEKLTGSGAST